MPVEETALTRLEANIVQVESIGIGLYRTNDTLNLASNQFLVIGEGTVESTPSLVQHNLIVDNTGVAINASLTDRDASANRGYALYVKGDLMVEGSIRGNQFTSNPSSNINGDRFWSAVTYNVNNNIYSTNQVNVSSELQARSNTYKFNVVATPNRDIQRSHLSLQNTELSQLRVGILGNASNSPVVFNTPASVPIEFHVGRDRTFFSNVYTEAVYGNPGNLVDLNTPLYTSETSPHLIIDSGGDVGIHTSQSQTFSFSKAFETSPGSYGMSNVSDRMGLYVNAPMYASDVLVYDAYSGTACNIDSIYVRSIGQSLDPSQIRPGTFAHGIYTFTSNLRLTLATPGVDAFGLETTGNARFGCNVVIEGTLTALNGVTLSNLEVLGAAHFTDSIQSDTIIYASNVLRFGSFIQTVGPDGNWCNVNFSVSNPSGYCNIEEIGGNVFVRNRMAVGLNLSNAEAAGEVFHQQFHIEKTVSNRYELALWDRTLQPWNRKVAVLGHADLDAERVYEDASFVIATGTASEDFYNGVKIFKSLPELPQNIYFYPGQYEHSNVYRPLIREDNPPVLGVFYNHRVGIGTYTPLQEFHVEGDMYASGDYFVKHPTMSGGQLALAKIYQNNAIGRIGIPSVFAGAEYINAAAPHVGINTAAQYEYGMVVAGGLKLVTGSALYNGNDQQVGLWLQGGVVSGNSSLYTTQSVGIGVTGSVYPLEIFETENSRPTYINIQANQVEVESALNYSKGGVRLNAVNQTWVMEAGVPYANKTYVKQSFAVYDTRSTGSNVLMAGQYFIDGRHQMFIGDIYDAGDYGPSNSTYDDALIVGGNTTVFGSLKVTSNLDVDGAFVLRGCNITIVGGSNAVPVPLAANPNDILVTGSVIHLLPKAETPNSTFTSPTQIDTGRESYVSIGYTQDTDVTVAQKTDYSTYPILRIHQYINSLTIARFSSTRAYALFDLETGRSGTDASSRMRYGLDYSTGLPTLMFLDRTSPSQPKYFLKSVKQVNNAMYTGFNLPYTSEPAANAHIYNSETGENMLLLQYASTIDSVTYAPMVQLHRDNTSTVASHEWQMKGPRPDSAQPSEQKLSFIYTFSQPSAASSNNEVMTLLSGGKVGINNTSPSYALDLRCTQDHHAIRLYSPTNSSTGMLLFQSGPSNTFGADTVYDYRMYASNNGFYMDQQSSQRGLVRVLNVDSNANVGIRTAASSNYAVNIGGYLNVSDGILINGFPFLYRQATSNVITGGIRVDDNGNIFINPASFNYVDEPGLVIGAGVASCNLVHIYSGSNANLMVYDSIYEEAQVHFRTRSLATASNSTYRMQASNQSFQIEYNPTHSTTNKITSSHTGYVPMASWDYLGATNYTSVLTSNTGWTTLRGDLRFQTASQSAGLVFESGSVVVGSSNGDVTVVPVGDGRVGLGTAAPGAFLDVRGNTSNGTPLVKWTQNGNGALAVLESGGGGGGESVWVNAVANVGIGTSTPISKLHVEDSIYGRSVFPVGWTADTSVGSASAPWHSGYYASNLYLNRVALSNVGGTLRFENRDTGLPTTKLQYTEWIAGGVNEDDGLTLHVRRAENSNLMFITSNIGTDGEAGRVIPLVYSPTTRRVGIRTDSPGAVFEILSDASETTAAMRISSANACNLMSLYGSNEQLAFDVSGYGTIGIGTAAASGASVGARVELYVPLEATQTALNIYQEGAGDLLTAGTAACNALWVKSTGRVGMGTTAPTEQLHVEGNIYATGTITASNLNVINLVTNDVEITFSEQVTITNTGTDTALIVNQTGAANIAEWQSNAVPVVTIDNAGWVGIGTTVPTVPLDVLGTLRASNLTVEWVTSEQVTVTNTGTVTALIVNQTEVGVGALMEFQSNAVPVVTIDNAGWVGIGTTAPTVPLDVQGKALYKNNYDTAGSLPAAVDYGGLCVGLSNATTAVYDPYYSTGAQWSQMALYQDILNALEDRKGLKFTVDSVTYSPASNIQLSGDGIYPDNSNMPELSLYRGFTYRFSNVSPEVIQITSNTGVEYTAFDYGLVHDTVASNASIYTKSKVAAGEQLRFTVPMNAVVGSNYRYQLDIDSNVYGVLAIV